VGEAIFILPKHKAAKQKYEFHFSCSDLISQESFLNLGLGLYSSSYLTVLQEQKEMEEQHISQ
jgi:hypothetical protein